MGRTLTVKVQRAKFTVHVMVQAHHQCAHPNSQAARVLIRRQEKNMFCKSRTFCMLFIFIYFVRGGFRTKRKCIRKIQSKSENPQRSVAVRKFHAYKRSGVPRIRTFSAYKIFWIYSMRNETIERFSVAKVSDYSLYPFFTFVGL